MLERETAGGILKYVFSKKSLREGFYINLKDSLKALMIFAATTLVSFFFSRNASDPTLNIAMLYTLGVFLVSRLTNGYLLGLIFSACAVLSVNFFFTYPFKDFNFTLSGYQVTFAGMLLISTITSVMSTAMKEQSRLLLEQEKAMAEQEKVLLEAEKEKMRANLLRAVSHDLRTPLTGIIGSSDSYLEMGDEMGSRERTELVRAINNDANWLLNMVENLLSVTKIDNTSAGVNTTVESVDEVVSAAVVQFKKRFPDSEVRVSLPDDVVLCRMDPMLIQQVMLNILQNAEMHAKSKRPVEFTIRSEGEKVYFHIRDYGIGIAENRLESIFDGEGYRSENMADSYRGMGIGLSICKTIIKAHGEDIWAVNHEDGAEFIFTLSKEN